jgi:chemotaxis protein MotB
MGHGGGGGCPLYWLTWADMITLLMTFFVVMASLGKIENNEKYNAMVESLRETFGAYAVHSTDPYNKDGGKANAADLLKRLKDEVSKQGGNKKNAKDSQLGKSATVRNIRDGLMITVGGLSLFEDGKAELLPEAESDLANVSRIVKGYRNKILIRGHTSRNPLPKDSKFGNDHMSLAYARALAVLEYLAGQGVARDRMNIEACAGNEPVKTFVYDEDAAASNRRVEIVVKDQMVEEFEGEARK